MAPAPGRSLPGTLDAAIARNAGDSVRVVFLRDHQHAGVEHREGSTLTVTPEEAELLRMFGAVAP